MCRKGAKLELTVGVTLVKLFRMQAHGFFIYLCFLKEVKDRCPKNTRLYIENGDL